jgi:MFS family permease
MDSASDLEYAKSFEKISFSSYSFTTSDNNYSTNDLVGQDNAKVSSEGNAKVAAGDGKLIVRVSGGANAISFPEGGLTAWLVVFGSWCALLSSLGIMNTMGAFQEHISTHQLANHKVDAVGWIFSLYAFLAFGVSLFVGPVFDKYGPRWLILSGSVLVTASMATIGVSQSMFNSSGTKLWTNLSYLEYWHFILSFSVAGGVGSALLFSPSIAIVGHYFDKRRGHATGIAVTGGALGGVVFPLLLQSLIGQIGFGWATRAVSLICFVLCIFANICIRGRLPPSEKASSWPDPRILKHPAFSVTVMGIFLVSSSFLAESPDTNV